MKLGRMKARNLLLPVEHLQIVVEYMWYKIPTVEYNYKYWCISTVYVIDSSEYYTYTAS